MNRSESVFCMLWKTIYIIIYFESDRKAKWYFYELSTQCTYIYIYHKHSVSSTLITAICVLCVCVCVHYLKSRQQIVQNNQGIKYNIDKKVNLNMRKRRSRKNGVIIRKAVVACRVASCYQVIFINLHGRKCMWRCY